MSKKFKNVYEDYHKCLTTRGIKLKIIHYADENIAIISFFIYPHEFLVSAEHETVAFLGDRTEAIKEGQRLFNLQIQKENKNEGG